MKIRQAVIPVAGFGTRFLPVTKTIPKSMLPIVDKPIIHYIVEELVDAGIEHIVFITNHSKRAIEDYFDNLFELEHTLETSGKFEFLDKVRSISEIAKFSYVRQKEVRGSGYVLKYAEHLLKEEPFLVSFEDELFAPDGENVSKSLVETFRKNPDTSGIISTIDVPREDQSKYGIAETETEDSISRIRKIFEKPKNGETVSTRAFITRAVLTPKIFERIDNLEKDFRDREMAIPDIISSAIEDGESFLAQNFDVTRFDTGSKIGYMSAVIEFALKDHEMNDDFYTLLKNKITQYEENNS